MNDQDNPEQDSPVVDIVPVESAPADPKDLLPPEEREILTTYEELVLAKDPSRSLASSTAEKFFSLYIHGYNCKEIHEINSSFPIGMIIHAKVKFRWDQRRDEHVQELMGRVREKVMLTQLESAHYLTDVLSAVHKLHGQKVKKFMQTGNEEDLKGVDLGTQYNYARTFDMISKLTGQTKDKNVTPPLQITVTPAAAPSTGAGSVPASSGSSLAPDDAATLLKGLLDLERERNKKK